MSDETGSILFSASTVAISHISKVLKALSLVSSNASITISEQGLKISVDTPSHTCQAHLFLTDNLFTSYDFNPPIKLEGNEDSFDVFSFGISLTNLISCLQMFSSDSSSTERRDESTRSNGINAQQNSSSAIPVATCRFVYRGKGYPFLVLLSSGKQVSTKCEFTVLDSCFDYAEDHMIQLNVDNLVQKIIITGQIMEEAMKELETINTSIVTFRASSMVAPHFTIISHGPIGSSSMVFPNEKTVLENFSVLLPATEESPGENQNIVVTNSYQYENINKAKEAVHLATKVSLRCDAYGLMSLQSMYEFGVGNQIFLDFRFVPSEEPQAEIYR